MSAAWVLIGLCLALALLPPRYDPAIRLRLWLEQQRRRRK